MIRHTLIATVLLTLASTAATADDDLLSTVQALEANAASDTQFDALEPELIEIEKSDQMVEVQTDGLGQADVDSLLGEDQESNQDAVAACYRRFGGGFGHGGFGYGHRGFGYGHYTPVAHNYYSAYCYRPVVYHRPIYTGYWGCW